MTAIIYGDAVTPVAAATVGDSQLWLTAEGLQVATGWEIKPEGICRAEVCITVRDRPELLRQGATGQELDLAGFARLLGQPVAREASADVWAFAPSVAERRTALLDLQAPDFTLPDFADGMHSLADYRDRKVVLLLWASW